MERGWSLVAIPRRRARARLALACSIPILVLAGCGTTEPPKGAPATTVDWDSATPSPSETRPPSETGTPAGPASTGRDQTAGDRTPAAQPQTDDGAKAFVAGWFAGLNSAYRTGDGATVQELSEDDCTACADFLTRWATVTVPGKRSTADVFTVAPVAVTQETDDVRYVSFRYTINAVTFQSAESGDTLDTQAEPARELRAVLIWTGERWSMGEIGP